MSRYRDKLPQLGNEIFIADGGMGTTLIFHEGLELPHFCTFPLQDDPQARAMLDRYFRDYLSLAAELETGFILDSGPTWRASADWGAKLGYGPKDLARINRQAIEWMLELRSEYDTASAPIVVSGCLGPRGDGYEPGVQMTAQAAKSYHRDQIESFAAAGADMVTAMTMTYAQEAVGVTQAALAAEMPVVISFTVETDGRLPTGQDLSAAIEQVDDATAGGPAYYMVNCAHPTHFSEVLDATAGWSERLRGIRLNASCLSHAELDEATDLDDGDAHELAAQVAAMVAAMPQITVVGGCCGTDQRHIREMTLRVNALRR